MLGFLKKKLWGSFSDRELKKYDSIVAKINSLEDSFNSFSREQCLDKVEELKDKAKQGTSLDDILPEAYALTRKAAMETLGERHFDVQLLGGIALHKGLISEMKTGEGKTLTSTLPLFLNALPGKGVHLVTVNDYLAERDSAWMGRIYGYLGMTVGVIKHDMNDAERREAYLADITYGTNNEFGFDYLRDNMKFDLDDYVQREHYYAIVDEVDSILIDEARTPLIISGPASDSNEYYYDINKLVYGLVREWRVSDNPEPTLLAKHKNISPEEAEKYLKECEEDLEVVIPGHYTLEEKTRNIQLSEKGVEEMQKRLKSESLLKTPSLYDFDNIDVLHHVNQALKAHYIFKPDVDYVVQDGRVLIVDEFTGRIMEGRRFSDGLHQALEAREGVTIEKENQTLATITFQNYFRKYQKLAGMTGTAATEADEFMKIYGLGVVEVPTNKPMIRKDQPDVIYKSLDAKYKAILDQIKNLYQKGQPMLIGTASIQSSEILSRKLKGSRIPHKVLNAKFHKEEAEIIARAGEVGAITIATNMAGRGTDIKLGKEVDARGGLYILGTERNESRRVDNQLRGRSGRQGDSGESRYFLSLEDELLRIFGGERIISLMNKLKIDEDESIEHVLISRAIENSQKKVEAYNFEIRKHLLEYDDVMNRQRDIVYKQRANILGGSHHEVFSSMIEETTESLLTQYCDERNIDDWDLEGLQSELFSSFKLKLSFDEISERSRSGDKLFGWLVECITDKYEAKKEDFGEVGDIIMCQILLEITDSLWKDHLLSMDYLKEGIGMRGYAQKNPLNEYKKEGYELFKDMIGRISNQCVRTYFQVEVVARPIEEIEQKPQKPQKMEMISGQSDLEKPNRAKRRSQSATVRKKVNIGRNDPCYCGSGKKYKKCCRSKDESRLLN